MHISVQDQPGEAVQYNQPIVIKISGSGVSGFLCPEMQFNSPRARTCDFICALCLQPVQSEQTIKMGVCFYLKNYFAQEYFSVDSNTSSLSATHSKRTKFIFVPVGPEDDEEQFLSLKKKLWGENRIQYNIQLRLALAHEPEKYLMVVRNILQGKENLSFCFSQQSHHSAVLTLQELSLDPRNRVIQKGYPFRLLHIEHQLYMNQIISSRTEDSRSVVKMQLQATSASSLIRGNFTLVPAAHPHQFYIAPLISHSGFKYLGFVEPNNQSVYFKQPCSNALFQLVDYHDAGNSQKSVIGQYLMHKASRMYLSAELSYQKSQPHRFILSSQHTLLDLLSLTPVDETHLKILYQFTLISLQDTQQNFLESLKTFSIWLNKLGNDQNKQFYGIVRNESPNRSHADTGFLYQIQMEFFKYYPQYIDKLFRILKNVREYNQEVKNEVVRIFSLLCNKNIDVICLFLQKNRDFIADIIMNQDGNGTESGGMDICKIIDFQELEHYPADKIKLVLKHLDIMLYELFQKTGLDTPSALKLLHNTIKLARSIQSDLSTYMVMVTNTQAVRSFALNPQQEAQSKLDRKMAENTECVGSIYVCFAKFLPKLDQEQIRSLIISKTAKMQMRLLALQYLIQFLKLTQNILVQDDGIFLESEADPYSSFRAQQQSSEVLASLLSLKSYIYQNLQMFKGNDEVVGSDQIVSVRVMTQFLNLGLLDNSQIDFLITHLVNRVAKMQLDPEQYSLQYQYLSSVIQLVRQFLSKELHAKKNLIIYKTLRASFKPGAALETELKQFAAKTDYLKFNALLLKVMQFVKINGSNLKNSILYNKCQDLYYLVHGKTNSIVAMLTKTRVIQESVENVKLLQSIYGQTKSIIKNGSEQRMIPLKRLSQVIDNNPKEIEQPSTRLKIQLIFYGMGLSQILLQMLSKQDLGAAKIIFKIFCVFCKNNYINSLKVLSQLRTRTTDWTHAFASNQCGLFQLCSTIISSHILKQYEYLDILSGLFKSKPVVCLSFVQLLVLLVKPQNVQTQRLISQYFSTNLGIFQKLFSFSQPSHITLTLRLLNQLKSTSCICEETSRAINDSVPVDLYSRSASRTSFFNTADVSQLAYLTLDIELINFLCNYPPRCTKEEQMLAVVADLKAFVDRYSIIMRSFKPTSYDLLEKFAQNYPDKPKECSNICLFAAVHMTNLLKKLHYCLQQNFNVLISFSRLGTESNFKDLQAALARSVGSLAGAIVNIYEIYLLDEEYINNSEIYNNSLKTLSTLFRLEPQLRFYYNFNSPGESQRRNTSQLSVRPVLFSQFKAYFQNGNSVEKAIFQFSCSQSLKTILDEEAEKQRAFLKVLIEQIGFEFFLQILIFQLQELSSKSILLEEELRTAVSTTESLLFLSKFNHSKSSQFLIQYRFPNIFFKFLNNLHTDSHVLKTLFELSFNILQLEAGGLNLEVQAAFQSQFLNSSISDKRALVSRCPTLFYLRKIINKKHTQLSYYDSCTEAFKLVQFKFRGARLPIHTYVNTCRLIQFLCQSLNFQVKQVFAQEDSKGQKSVLSLMVGLFERALSILFAGSDGTGAFLISEQKYNFVSLTIQTINSMLHGPHLPNITKVLNLGYHLPNMRILSIYDSLQSIQTFSVIQHSVVDPLTKLVDQSQIRQFQPQFYNRYLFQELQSKTSQYNLILISKLKLQAILSLGLLFDQLSIGPFRKVLDDIAVLSQKNLMWMYAKMVEVYKDTSASDLMELMYGQRESQKMLDPSHTIIRKSLIIDTGIYLYIFLSKYYELNEISTIKESVYKFISEKRLMRRYRDKAGIFYQIFILVIDSYNAIQYGIRALVSRIRPSRSTANQKRNIYMGMIDFFAKNITTIEILTQQKQLHQVSFPMVPETRFWNGSIQRDVARSIDYSSNASRLSTFMGRMDYTLMRLEKERKLSSMTDSNKLLEIIIKNRELWKDLSFFTAILQNGFLLNQYLINPTYFQASVYSALAFQYTFQLLLLIVFFFQGISLRLQIADIDIKTKKITNKFKQFALRTWSILHDKTFQFVFLYTFFVSASLIQPVWLSVLLFDFFFRFKSAWFIVQLVIQLKRILGTLGLFIIFIYIYSFFYFREKQIEPALANYCQTLTSCINMYFFAQFGLIDANYIKKKNYNFGTFGLLSGLLFILFHLFINGLIIGIVINKKRKLYQQSETQRKFIEDNCFICGLSKDQINREGSIDKGFKKHIQLKHYKWNYVFYLMYLSKIKPEDMTAEEKYVNSCYQRKDFSWIPCEVKDIKAQQQVKT